MDLTIAEGKATKEEIKDLVQRRPDLLRIMSREKKDNARQAKVLRRRVDYHVYNKRQLEGHKKVVEDIQLLRKEIDRMRAKKGFMLMGRRKKTSESIEGLEKEIQSINRRLRFLRNVRRALLIGLAVVLPLWMMGHWKGFVVF